MLFQLVVLLGLFCYFCYYHLYGKRQRFPPGPMPLPLLGNALQLSGNQMPDNVKKLAKKYGDMYTLWLGNEAYVFINDYYLIKELLVDKRNAEISSGRPSNIVFDGFKDGCHGIVATNGLLWREQRRFSIQALRDFGLNRPVMEERIVREAEALRDHLLGLLQGNQRVELDPDHLIQLTIGNIISSVIVGKTFREDLERFSRLKQLLDDVVEVYWTPKMQLLIAYPWLRHLPFLDNFGFKGLATAHKNIFEFFEEEIDEHKKNDWTPDFLSIFLREKREELENGGKSDLFSRHQLLSIIFDIWGAGLETTVATLRWGLIYMIHCPDIQEKLYEELKEFLGGRSPSMSDRTHLPFLAATVMELQRHANILQVNVPRMLLKDVEFHGFHLPKGTTLIAQISAVHRDPRFFPNPEKFDPSRFLDDSGNLLKSEQLIPFSVGKRACLGESLAKMELFLILGVLLSTFQFSAPMHQPTPSLDEYLDGFQTTPPPFFLTVNNRH